MLPIKTILHPTDFSKHSDYAFRLACALARDYGARLVVVHVAEPPVPLYGNGLIVPPTATYNEPLRAKLHELLPRDPKVRVEHEFAEGDAAIEILRLAEETKCNLIVMGTHGRTGLGRLLMGSVAEQVVRKAPCPVLTVKTPIPTSPPPGETSSEACGSPTRCGAP
jgi:nucleotide-binding universal stress UspA family protein